MQALKRSGPRTSWLISSPVGPQPVLQLAHNLSLEFPDQISASSYYVTLINWVILIAIGGTLFAVIESY